ncbi:Peroxidasinlike [Caligus rogercresseyi]|uniref:Peroxidasinlike n=1 Tax=Caligus rogercresseyi TaxID=217165 RepID=A0A7T8GNK0_CALRO|nr:Peroxidasinlike [Caligus rogercresseyi]
MQVRWMIFLLLLSVSMVQSQSFEPSEYIDKIYSRLKSLLRLELLASKSPSGSNKGHSFITKPNPEAVLKYEESLLFEIATREGVRARPTRSSAPARCDTLRCSPQDPYSKLDGACNNVWKNRRWGARLQPLSRILASAYDDRISAPKIRSVDGKTFLPSARSVSNAFHKGNELNRTTNQK